MKCISIRQPWAWLILHSGKDIENRSWPTKYRGPLLIHAAKGMTRGEYEAVKDMVDCFIALPRFEILQRGGIVGEVDLIDCVTESDSPWFAGENYGFVLANPRTLDFVPMAGKLGIFNVSLGALV